MGQLLPGFTDYARRIGYRRQWIAGILALQLCAVVFEGVGIGIVLPILEFINQGGNVDQLAAGSGLWRWMLDTATTLSLPLNLVTLLGGAFAAIMMRQIFMYYRDVTIGRVQFELSRRVRNTGFHHYIWATLSYHDRVRAGDFVNELTTELTAAAASMTAAVSFISYLVLCGGYFVVGIAVSPELTGIAIVVLMTVSLALVRIMSKIRELGVQVTRANQQMSSFLVERLKSVRLVRLSGVEAAEEAMLAERTQDQRDRLFDRRRMMAVLSVSIEPIVLFVAFVLLYFSVASLGLSFETIIVFFFVLIRLVPIVKETLLQRQSYLANLASIEVLDKRLRELARTRDPAGGTRKLERLQDGIELREVSFHYSEGDSTLAKRVPALDRLSLTIPAHRMTALVGPSGAGKSTLVDLLPRLREPQSGQILFDGIPQREFETASLRRAISFAPQAPQMFNVTITEHIRYGWPEASMADVRYAAALAQAADFIEVLPEGYETLLGEGGCRLSGGQRQRVDLARALVRRAPILILDEPTANLDAEAEALFRQALDKVREETDITIVIIGHRLSTVMAADRIAVMEAGQITEAGTHAELMARSGWYARAFGKQHGADLAASAS